MCCSQQEAWGCFGRFMSSSLHSSCGVQPGCKCELASLQAPSQLSAQQTRTRPEIHHFRVPFSHLYWAFRWLQLREEISGDHLTPRHADTAQSELGSLACVKSGASGNNEKDAGHSACLGQNWHLVTMFPISHCVDPLLLALRRSELFETVQPEHLSLRCMSASPF